MKRLIKSELFSGYKKDENNYYECYIDPTNNEWNIINSDSSGNIRGFIGENGTLYIWNGNILHNDAINSFGIPSNNTQIKISIENGRIQYINSDSLNNKQTILTLQKCKSLLNFFNRDTQYIGFYPEFPIGDLGDIIDYNE